MPTCQLRSEHAELIRLSHQLRMHLYPAHAARNDELLLCRDRLYKLLTAHLQREDDMLYPRLIDGPDPQLAKTAEDFTREVGGLRDSVEVWMAIWTHDAITRGWDAFRAETEDLLDALSVRIVRENRELFPLIERMTVDA
ncbi:hemerythrin domain-containing protein [Flavisphingomonas formosensis]|uniref:hemerythrin domain-containing protein n=1 Tax=Flavisphingomonas formosensis TaxID=861534 RepID=UPI0012FC5536|nr:hemerythrin domain-containing protein [Sphingomonas formosensis]